MSEFTMKDRKPHVYVWQYTERESRRSGSRDVLTNATHIKYQTKPINCSTGLNNPHQYYKVSTSIHQKHDITSRQDGAIVNRVKIPKHVLCDVASVNVTWCRHGNSTTLSHAREYMRHNIIYVTIHCSVADVGEVILIQHLSRRHLLLTFSQKLSNEWENIWRKVVHIDHLNNIS
jgi:hypothetical protein